MENNGSPPKNESAGSMQNPNLFSSVKYYISGIVREDVSFAEVFYDLLALAPTYVIRILFIFLLP